MKNDVNLNEEQSGEFQTSGQTNSNIATVNGWLTSTHGIITSLMAILVVVPSLINAVMDVYTAAFNIPKTISEINNVQLFKQHFQQQPVHTAQSIISPTPGEQLPIKLDVYENGDIYIEYGEFSQWFPFKPSKNTASSWLIRSAYAQDTTTQAVSPCTVAEKESTEPAQPNALAAPYYRYMQTDKLEGSTILRDRVYEDGCKETVTIEMNTGVIQSRKTEFVTLNEEQKKYFEQGKGVQAFPPLIINTQKQK